MTSEMEDDDTLVGSKTARSKTQGSKNRSRPFSNQNRKPFESYQVLTDHHTTFTPPFEPGNHDQEAPPLEPTTHPRPQPSLSLKL